MNTIDMQNEIKQQLINAAKEFASETSGSIIVNNPAKYKAFRDGQDSAIKILNWQREKDKAVIDKALEVITKMYHTIQDDLLAHHFGDELGQARQLLNTIQKEL